MGLCRYRKRGWEGGDSSLFIHGVQKCRLFFLTPLSKAAAVELGALTQPLHGDNGSSEREIGIAPPPKKKPKKTTTHTHTQRADTEHISIS